MSPTDAQAFASLGKLLIQVPTIVAQIESYDRTKEAKITELRQLDKLIEDRKAELARITPVKSVQPAPVAPIQKASPLSAKVR